MILEYRTANMVCARQFYNSNPRKYLPSPVIKTFHHIVHTSLHLLYPGTYNGWMDGWMDGVGGLDGMDGKVRMDE